MSLPEEEKQVAILRVFAIINLLFSLALFYLVAFHIENVDVLLMHLDLIYNLEANL